jgi:putative membrane protein
MSFLNLKTRRRIPRRGPEDRVLKAGQKPIFFVLLIALIYFTYHYLGRLNYEFTMYLGVIVIFFILILATNKKVNYSNTVLWGLVVWALLHLSGGAFFPNGTLLYSTILIPISDAYNIFRYDQFVHIVGFAVATLLAYDLIKPHLNKTSSTSIGIVVVMAGLGFGAINEIIEFTATVLLPQTGVGGYINTSLDLVADLIGAVLAWIYIRTRK